MQLPGYMLQKFSSISTRNVTSGNYEYPHFTTSVNNIWCCVDWRAPNQYDGWSGYINTTPVAMSTLNPQRNVYLYSSAGGNWCMHLYA